MLKYDLYNVYMEVQFSILLYTNICCRFLSAESIATADLVYPLLGSDPIIDTDSKTVTANLTVLSPILIIIMISNMIINLCMNYMYNNVSYSILIIYIFEYY